MKISLKAARVNANLTQQEVANLIRVSKHTIINWEKGKTSVGYAPLKVLSEIYNVQMENIFID
ncbi:MAG: helix-turn-helix transcriptional regulator [bacterium]